ncbi:2-C-methyl-D-erythritol 4-phosphate cytidylyltransferase [Bacillaceae bacterium SIJ1]|uniref:2-C-methyl-D-erythritol 4-phosphate cytidylyltransferase n=1 Tax=Litoribacterium kuwaitense TaxID=1398745 RepID=UPI0013ECB0A6|nr:2-C-methyl-D-erythritol 4-phosphate cytidylyltransferase [Litoribacterium kuwaitense]NGP46718.1 2-C-methyl-D-erythritol 4-phosphate cytidylyltransferase [Litoribacterium kuwaitense]
MTYTVVIPAAGKGKRMQTTLSKQFIPLFNKPLIVWTLEQFAADPLCQQIVLVIDQAEEPNIQSILQAHDLLHQVTLVQGGVERQYSVAAGLKATDEHVGIVLVHDGARPFVTKSIIRRLCEEASRTKAAVAAVRLKDTVKSVTDGVITETLDRERLWSIQTPQAFSRDVLLEAHDKAVQDGFLGTDEASLVERIQYPVSIVEGSYRNIKITTQEDLIVAEAFMREEQS